MLSVLKEETELLHSEILPDLYYSFILDGRSVRLIVNIQEGNIHFATRNHYVTRYYTCTTTLASTFTFNGHANLPHTITQVNALFWILFERTSELLQVAL